MEALRIFEFLFLRPLGHRRHLKMLFLGGPIENMIGVSVLYSDPSVHVKKKQSEGSKLQYQPGKELKPGEYLNCKLKLCAETFHAPL